MTYKASTKNPMSPAQANYLMKLIFQAFANDPKGRRIALDNMAKLDSAAAASSMIDMLKAGTKAQQELTAAQKIAAANAAIKVVIPTKGVKLLIDGTEYHVKKHGWKDQYSVFAGGGYLGTLGMGKTAVVEEILADPALYAAKATEYGHTTKRCCFCHTKLKDPVSIAKGYGPVCEGKYL